MSAPFAAGNKLLKFGAAGLISFNVAGGGNQGGGGGNQGSGNGSPSALTISSFNMRIPTSESFGQLNGVIATGGLGQYTYSIDQTGITDISYEMNATTGYITFYSGQGPWTVGRVDTFYVVVTDATGATARAPCTVTFQTAGVITGGTTGFFNSQTTNGATTFSGFQTTGPGFASSDVVIHDPTGVFSGTDYLYCHQANWPAPGNYPITCTVPLSAGGTLTQNFIVPVINDPGPAFINWTQTLTTLSSSRLPGTVVGQALADGSNLPTTYALSSGNNGAFSINGLSGVVSVFGTLQAGTYTVAIVATRSGQSLTQYISIVVVQGNTIAASAMNCTVATNLTNWVLSDYNTQPKDNPRLVATPTLPAGITGTPIWTITDQLRSPIDEDTTQGGHGYTRYVINTSTGVITALAQLSAQTDSITFSVTDGINTCTKTINPVIAAVVGPIICVGQGMSTAYAQNGGSIGYEHWVDFVLTAQSQSSNAIAGATIKVYSNSDPNYYANDNGNGLDPRQPNNYATRFGLHGPFTIIGVQGSGGPRPRFGGNLNSVAGGEGVDIGSKGFLVLSDGDMSISNIDFSDIHANGYQGNGSPSSNSTGCAIRQNGTTWGNLSVTDCSFVRCDQGIESGAGPSIVRLLRLFLTHCGSVYVGSGATHNIYISSNAQLFVDHVVSFGTINGHCLKSRAYYGRINNSEFYDGERGGASCQTEIPDGGDYIYDTCVFQKGPQPQNPLVIQFCAEMTKPQNVCTLIVQNSTIICDTPTNAIVNGIYMWGRTLVTNGAYSTAQSINNKFYGFPAGTTEVAVYSNAQGPNITGVSDGRACAVVSTGSTKLTVRPSLDFTDPSTGVVNARQGAFYFNYDGENRNNWVNFQGYDIDIGSDDIVLVASSAPVGTVIITPTITPCPYTALAPGYTNPFASGAVWSIRNDAGPYTGGLYGVAPAGTYSINPATGSLTVAQNRPSGTHDNIIYRVTATNGTVFQQGFYVYYT